MNYNKQSNHSRDLTCLCSSDTPSSFTIGALCHDTWIMHLNTLLVADGACETEMMITIIGVRINAGLWTGPWTGLWTG